MNKTFEKVSSFWVFKHQLQKADLMPVITKESISKCFQVSKMSHPIFRDWSISYFDVIFGSVLYFVERYQKTYPISTRGLVSETFPYFIELEVEQFRGWQNNMIFGSRDFLVFLKNEGGAVQGPAIWKDFAAPQEARCSLDGSHLPSQWQLHWPSKGKERSCQDTC